MPRPEKPVAPLKGFILPKIPAPRKPPDDGLPRDGGFVRKPIDSLFDFTEEDAREARAV